MILRCACCGGDAPGKQWWNRDTGYGVCKRCFLFAVEKEGVEHAVENYGQPGIHHSLPEPPNGMKYTKTEWLDNKPIHCYIEI